MVTASTVMTLAQCLKIVSVNFEMKAHVTQGKGNLRMSVKLKNHETEMVQN